jgi:hypothetical protein
MPFYNKQDSTIATDVQNLSEKINNLCSIYAKTRLLTKGKQHDYYATPAGIAIQFNRNFGERLATALYRQNIGISRIA